MDFIDKLILTAKEKPATVVFPEGNDARIIKAADELSRLNALNIILLGDESLISGRLSELNQVNIKIINPEFYLKSDAYADELYQLRKDKGVTREMAKELISDPLVLACLMVRLGDADGCVAGAVNTTASVVRNAIQIVGVSPDAGLVSSFFIEILANQVDGLNEIIFADCALNIAPDSNQLAEIAKATVVSARKLLKVEPKVAFLSFSTNGSASHEQVDKVRIATEIAKQAMPDVEIIGEIQLDAALNNQVLTVKYPDADFTAPANILIFPSLEAGNIGYKLVQQLTQAKSIGPILQGLKKQVNDLSRSATVEEIIAVSIVTANLAP